jgi:hypothetical protein
MLKVLLKWTGFKMVVYYKINGGLNVFLELKFVWSYMFDFVRNAASVKDGAVET